MPAKIVFTIMNSSATTLMNAGQLALIGANDHLARELRIACLPEPEDCKKSIERLARRLGVDIPRATAVYARGGINATPLALPELLDVLVQRLAPKTVAAKGKKDHDRVAAEDRR